MTDTFPVLYILMRTDLASMNCGKGMAQAAHATSAFAHIMEPLVGMLTNGRLSDNELVAARPKVSLYHEWKTSTSQGFGTVLVLAVDETQMRTAVDIAEKIGFVSGSVNDPTYPLRDGDSCHFIPLDTCAYIFGSKNNLLLSAIVGNFPLHP